MSASAPQQAVDQEIELGAEVSWPHIYAAAGIGTVALIAVLVLTFLTASRDAPKDDRATVPGEAPRLVRTLQFPQAEKRVASIPPVAEEKTARPAPQTVVPKPEKTEQPRPSTKTTAVAASRTPAQTRADVPKPAEVEAAPEPPLHFFKRRDLLTEDELRLCLARIASDLDIETEKGTTARLLAEAKKAPKPSAGAAAAVGVEQAGRQPAQAVPIMELAARRTDLKGLPMRDAAKCQVSPTEARAMHMMSLTIRLETARRARTRDQSESGLSYGQVYRRDMELAACLKEKMTTPEWRQDAGVRLAAQMFQHEAGPVQAAVFNLLAANKGKTAGEIIAQRAIFDLRSEVREAAVEKLKDRPTAEVRPVLLAALRYPWPPAADHAAEALVALGDRESVLDLVELLDRPDPAAPTQDKDKKWMTAQLVRVNHLGNCVLCHAPSTAKEDPVRGVVPERGKPLPVVYYADRSGGDAVRADITYLKQDFSLTETVSEPNKWPARQRFDYLVRQRELRGDEVARLPAAGPTSTAPTGYPQRESVLWALRELTCHDLGQRSENWRQYLIEEWLAHRQQQWR